MGRVGIAVDRPLGQGRGGRRRRRENGVLQNRGAPPVARKSGPRRAPGDSVARDQRAVRVGSQLVPPRLPSNPPPAMRWSHAGPAGDGARSEPFSVVRSGVSAATPGTEIGQPELARPSASSATMIPLSRREDCLGPSVLVDVADDRRARPAHRPGAVPRGEGNRPPLKLDAVPIPPVRVPRVIHGEDLRESVPVQIACRHGTRDSRDDRDRPPVQLPSLRGCSNE